MDRKRLRIPAVALVFFIFFVNYAATIFHWYSAISWFDMLMHFLGGFWVALFFAFLFPPKRFSFKFVLRTLLVVFIIGILWEIFEVSVNSITVKDSFDSIDTVSDLVFDILGGVGTLVYSYFKREKFDIMN